MGEKVSFKKIFLGSVVIVTGLMLAGIAAYFSVFGISKMYAGAAAAVMVMAGVLEFSKIVIASVLDQYWSELKGMIKVYMVTGLAVLMIITSLGIYGFLTSAYKQTSTEMASGNKVVEVVEMKKNRFVQRRVALEKERDLAITDKSRKEATLADLRSGMSTDKVDWVKVRTVKSAEKELADMKNRFVDIERRLNLLDDTIGKLEIQVLSETTKNSAKSELGPLIYISDITGASMDKVVNWFTLLIVIVFDPLAICLIIVFNKLFGGKNDVVSRGERVLVNGGIDEFFLGATPVEHEADRKLFDNQYDDYLLLHERLSGVMSSARDDEYRDGGSVVHELKAELGVVCRDIEVLGESVELLNERCDTVSSDCGRVNDELLKLDEAVTGLNKKTGDTLELSRVLEELSCKVAGIDKRVDGIDDAGKLAIVKEGVDELSRVVNEMKEKPLETFMSFNIDHDKINNEIQNIKRTLKNHGELNSEMKKDISQVFDTIDGIENSIKQFDDKITGVTGQVDEIVDGKIEVVKETLVDDIMERVTGKMEDLADNVIDKVSERTNSIRLG